MNPPADITRVCFLGAAAVGIYALYVRASNEKRQEDSTSLPKQSKAIEARKLYKSRKRKMSKHSSKQFEETVNDVLRNLLKNDCAEVSPPFHFQKDRCAL